ncbi:MAG TPA: response regulator [Bryobacteraceae bacterium]|jgi:CheY-like chemotaxis protein|nr:response regulator [Bryobacteraceae bacterium]
MAHEAILIIDDHPANVKLARLLLINAGYEVRTAGDSTEALETLRCFSPRLILMDIQLPGMDGLQLTRRLKNDPTKRDSIIVALTAYAMRGDEERAKAAGCDGYMCKPIDTRTFVNQIQRYLEKRAEQAGAATTRESADPNDLLRELRNSFLAEGAEASHRYVETDCSDEIEAMRRVVHHWAGMGGTLGFPEITKRARELDDLLEASYGQAQPEVVQRFADIRELFARGIRNADEPSVPEDLVENLASKQVGLIGFCDSEAARVRAAFDQVHATARDLGALSQGLGMDAMRAHDLIILNTCTEEGIRCWESVAAQPLLEKPVLLISSRTALLDSKLALLDRAVDFVMAPWDSEELLCRARRMIGQRPKPLPPAVERNSKPLVVIADDDPIIHSLLAPMLIKLGVDTFSVRDGQEALDAVRKLSPDVLVLDIGMPRMSGLSVLREIRKVQGNHTLQILMFSVRQQQNDIGMAFAYGANDYAVKPFDPEDVSMRIIRLVGHLTASLSHGS